MRFPAHCTVIIEKWGASHLGPPCTKIRGVGGGPKTRTEPHLLVASGEACGTWPRYPSTGPNCAPQLHRTGIAFRGFPRLRYPEQRPVKGIGAIVPVQHQCFFHYTDKYLRLTCDTIWHTKKKMAAFSASIPFSEPLWYSRGISPYYKESHHHLRAEAREYVDTHLSPFCEEWEREGTVPGEVRNSPSPRFFCRAV